MKRNILIIKISKVNKCSVIDSTTLILSVKGNVNENGMPRFFRRIHEGVFDEEDLLFRTNELNDFIDKVARDYNFDRDNVRDNVVAIGYSNGANIAASLLLLCQNSLKGAIIHHPMLPIRDITVKSLKGVPIFIGAGYNDTICKPEDTKGLISVFKDFGADLSVDWEYNGHSLINTEIQVARKWYNKKFCKISSYFWDEI